MDRRHRLASLFLVWMALLASPVRAEHLSQNPSGEVSFRGNYWRDRNTRVLNPTVDLQQSLDSGITVGGHYVLDAITSASIAAGVTSDEPFTELRHEAGFNLAVPLPRKVTLSGSYSYSTESDYFSHSAGLRASTSLFQDNTTLLFGVDYGHNTVGKRLGPTGYLLQGVLHTVHLVALWNQVLTRSLLATLSYEATLGMGYMANPYRPVVVAGERREVERLPTFRARHVFSLSLHHLTSFDSSLVPHLTLRPALRVFLDCWGTRAVSPELAVSLPIGPVELRGLFAYYGQSQALFYRSEGPVDRAGFHPLTPFYNESITWNTCQQPGGASDPEVVYTSDVKLGSYSTYTWDFQIKWRLSFFQSLGTIGERLSRAVLELSGGMWFADGAVGNQYGIPFSSNDSLAPAGCADRCGAGFAALGLTLPL